MILVIHSLSNQRNKHYTVYGAAVTDVTADRGKKLLIPAVNQMIQNAFCSAA
jgi:hypothetical protein